MQIKCVICGKLTWRHGLSKYCPACSSKMAIAMRHLAYLKRKEAKEELKNVGT